jgi:GH18 family chitinase
MNVRIKLQDGIPEQFWNCAEITIQPKSSLDPLASNLAAQTITNQHAKTIIGYYASWQWYDRDKLASPVNMDFRKISRVK